MYLNNHSQRPLGLWGVRIAPQSSVEVEANKRDWKNHMFVRAGWVTFTQEPESFVESKEKTPKKKVKKKVAKKKVAKKKTSSHNS